MIYLDNAATTNVNEDTANIIRDYLIKSYYNPSALYREALNVQNDINKVRECIANRLNVSSDEIIFVSSGTEADNASLMNTKKRPNSRIIISEAEHSAIYNTAMALKSQGYDVVQAPVDRYGRVIEDEFTKLLDDNTALVSIIHVNNETGAINDIQRLSELTKAYNKNIIFHSDGVQAFTKVPISFFNSSIDMYSISGHKFNAPKGIGILYKKKNIHLKPMLYGGGQEQNYRSSTENTAGIIALRYSMEHSILNYSKYYNTMQQLLQNMAQFIVLRIPDCIINTDIINTNNYASNILSLAFKGVRGETLMHSLEKHGIIIGIGSACSSKKGVKRIPDALGLPKEYHDGIIRISISPDISKEDLEYAGDMIVKEYSNLSKYIRG